MLDPSYISENVLFFHKESGRILRPLYSVNEFLRNEELREVLRSCNVVDFRTQAYGNKRYLSVEPFFFPNSAANWSYGMYRDALACQSGLAATLGNSGYSLIDGHCFNVIFYYCQPVFVDLGSIVQGSAGKGMVELSRYRKALTSYRLSSALSTRQRFDSELEPPRYLDVAKDIFSPDPFVDWRSKLRRLLGLRGRSAWIDYYTSSPESYRDLPKERVVRSILEEAKPATVYDIGCNTGHYSLIAESCGARVVAADPDPECVDYLYNSVKRSGKKILPLVADLDGFLRAVERPYRNLRPKKVDLVLMLALIHHLTYRALLQFDEVFEKVAKLGAESLVIEFVSKDDDNVAAWDLVSPREWYTLENLRSVGSRYFGYHHVYDSHDKERQIVHFKGRRS